mmetsp:Transcript_4860/g.7167  ORF Transcript_4860/g.7167 Transcript_4860/m.7167 type:complete len:86 (-) Transcript_4860:575-832(-)
MEKYLYNQHVGDLKSTKLLPIFGNVTTITTHTTVIRFNEKQRNWADYCTSRNQISCHHTALAMSSMEGAPSKEFISTLQGANFFL